MPTITRQTRNKRHKPMTAQEREDARDFAIIKRGSKKATYSFNEFMKELGLYDLVTPRKRHS